MAKVTLYTRPVDNDAWEWARQKAEQDRLSLSRIVADALRAYRAATHNPRGASNA